jgi:hypothetical protein
MKQRGLMRLAILAALWACSCAESQGQRVSLPKPDDVLEEMSRRSSVPKPELRDMLSNCDVNQRNTYFCAFRDFVMADLTIGRVATDQARRYPTCKSRIESDVARLRQRRDEQCEKTADDAYGEGSMKLTAQAMCAASENETLIAEIKKITSC